jgi:hypothetical protein
MNFIELRYKTGGEPGKEQVLSYQHQGQVFRQSDGPAIWRACPASAGAERKVPTYDVGIARSQPEAVACYPTQATGRVPVL